MLLKDQQELNIKEDIQPLLADIADQRQEHFVVITLDSKKKVIKKRIVFIGTVNTVLAHPREIFACALEDRASSIIVAHNHPSGDPTPSKEDIAMTEQLVEAGRILGIKLLRHIVITIGEDYRLIEISNQKQV